MEPSKPSTALFDVFLRLRPALTANSDRFLDVERYDADEQFPKHITVQPPSDNRKRAVEKFAFTRVFEEKASQLELLEGTGAVGLIDGVLGGQAKDGRDGLLATLGVTGSGKSHTILGSKNQRGLTQMTLDVLYRSIGQNIVHPSCTTSVFPSLVEADVSEAHIVQAMVLLESLYGDVPSTRGSCSRAQTPMPVNSPSSIPSIFLSPNKPQTAISRFGNYSISQSTSGVPLEMPGSYPLSRETTPITGSEPPRSSSRLENKTVRPVETVPTKLPTLPGSFARLTRSKAAKQNHVISQDTSYLSLPAPTTKPRLPRPSAMPSSPSVEHINLAVDNTAEYAVILSMYEVYNDRIYDLLAGAASRTNGKTTTAQKIRRPLLFKSTEMSPDRKVVAGLKKVVCATLEEALSVLEIGLAERKVAGTGSNAVSSRSHGFFCVEVKRRPRVAGAFSTAWSSATLTIVDLAGSERARQAKTQGQTLAEAGKINESLMYLGQCMQMQGDHQDGKQNIVPFRQCKLTELLFSNSFPSAPSAAATHHYSHLPHHHRNAQKGIMIVTADPVGDFNATSQILRYSALAREVTVPRIPSVSSTIITTGAPSVNASISRPGTSLADHPSVHPRSETQLSADLSNALLTISSLTTERDIALLQAEEERRHAEALEAFIQTSDIRWAEREQEIRDDCFEEMERVLETERRRWKEAWTEEEERVENFLDKKIEIVTRDVEVYEDADAASGSASEQRVNELEDEVQMLRRRLRELERSMASEQSSPSKRQKTVADDRFRELQDENQCLKLELEEVKKVPAVALKSPTKKMRPLKAKKWDVDLSIGED